jgi:hypothetical protein
MTQLGFLLLQLGLAVGIPALIAIYASRRWRLWLLLLWVSAPLLVGIGLAASEMLSGKASPADLDKLIYGLLLIGSFLVLPWLIACGAGYAMGAMLRRRLSSPAVAVEPAAPHSVEPAAEPDEPAFGQAVDPRSPPTDPEAPSLSPPSGWQTAHIGLDHDDLVLDGLPIWSLPWRQETAEPVTLAHPAHPEQRHAFTIYTVDDGSRATRFAAAELSSGVWGFYRWVVPADAAAGTSADGSLRYEQDLGPFEHRRYDALAPVARLYDAATGVLLFDGANWASSRLVPQADGSLLLALDQRDWETIFHIDPAGGSFRDLTVAGDGRPLAQLAAAAAAARAECDDPANTYVGRRIAPDGSLLVELEAVEWGNSHWVRSPRVIEIATGRVLVDLWGTDCDAVVSFPRSRTVHLSLRRYHFGGGAEVEIDLADERYYLSEPSGSTGGPLSQLREALDVPSPDSAAGTARRPPIANPRPTARSWGVALLILLGAFGLIAAATMITLHFEQGPQPRKLDRIPPMPGR